MSRRSGPELESRRKREKRKKKDKKEVDERKKEGWNGGRGRAKSVQGPAEALDRKLQRDSSAQDGGDWLEWLAAVVVVCGWWVERSKSQKDEVKSQVESGVFGDGGFLGFGKEGKKRI